MVEPLKFTQKVPISGHLIELKNRFVIVAIVAAFFFGVCFYFIEFFHFWLIDPMPDGLREKIITTEITEAFFTDMKIAIMGALFITMPLILYHTWFFIAPGLKVKEKKVTMMFVFFGTLFFVFGGLFCYFLVLPLGVRFLFNYGADEWDVLVTIKNYFSFVVKIILAFAFSFQTPLIMVLLTKFGVINTVKMRLYRKWAFMSTFLLAAVLTPPDVITQVLLAFPLYGLYEFGLMVSTYFEDPKAREAIYRQMHEQQEMKRAKKAAAEAAKEKARSKGRRVGKKTVKKPRAQ